VDAFVISDIHRINPSCC